MHADTKSGVVTVETLQGEFKGIETHDSITTWILAIGIVCAALAYPFIFRPLGLRMKSPVERKNGD